jgi:hypothetical protein
MSTYFGNFDVEEYMHGVRWVVYLDEEESKEETLDHINYYLSRNDERFEVKYGSVCKVVKKARDSVRSGSSLSSLYKLVWLKSVMSDRLPLLCHLMMKDKKVFMYLLKLSPWSVFESLDGTNSAFNFAVHHKLRWYYEKMLKCILREEKNNYGLVVKKVLSSLMVMTSLVYTKNWKDLRLVLKMMGKAIKGRGKGGGVVKDLREYCVEMYMRVNDERVANRLVDMLDKVDQKYWRRMLDHGIMNGWEYCVRKLLEKQEEEIDDMCESLMMAISRNHCGIMRLLLSSSKKKGGRGDLQVHDFETPLMYAIDICEEGESEMVEILLSANLVDVNYKCKLGTMKYFGEVKRYTALEVAANRGDKKILRLLFREDVEDDVDQRAMKIYLRGLTERGETCDKKVEEERKWWCTGINQKKKERVMECAGLICQYGDADDEGMMNQFMSKVDNAPFVLEEVLDMI